jgi:hypothetical protein
MLKNFILSLSCFAYICASAQSEYKNVQLESREGIFSSFNPCEPSIAIDPSNPKRMVAGSILNNVYKSYDGGVTWDHDVMKSRHGVYGDPTIVASPLGDFYYLHLGDPDQRGWSSSRLLESIVIQQLNEKKFLCKKNCWTDGIAIGTNAPKDQDKQWATTSKDGSEIYVTWTEFDKYESTEPNDHSRILFSKGKKGETSFSKPIAISDVEGGCVDDDNTVEGAVPAAGLNNEVYVAWAHQENIYFNKSLDGGNTWMPKSKVAMSIPGGWNQDIPGVYRANGMPILLSDLSNGQNRGNLYLCWSDERNGDVDVFVSSSSDGGEHWSEAVRVNNDEGHAHQFFPWMAVDAVTGNLYAVFYDRRNYTDYNTDVYLASSSDGGKTWANERISEKPFITNASVFLGDYNNISAVNGVVRPIWTRTDNWSKTSVWIALIQK